MNEPSGNDAAAAGQAAERELPGMDRSRMSFFEHLGELRARIFKSIIAVFVLTVAAFTFRVEIFHWIKRPLEDLAEIAESDEDDAAPPASPAASAEPGSGPPEAIIARLERVETMVAGLAAYLGSPPPGADAPTPKALKDRFEQVERQVEALYGQRPADGRGALGLGPPAPPFVPAEPARVVDAITGGPPLELDQPGSSARPSDSGAIVASGVPAQSRARMQALGLVEMFVVYLKLAVLAAIFAAAPWILFQAWRFVAPGLYAHEKRWLVPFVTLGSIFFVGGGLFAFYVVLPIGFPYLVAMVPDDVEANYRVADYIALVTRLLLAFGLVFELPLVMWILAAAGLVSPKSFSKLRKYWLVIAVILGAFLTPPDPMTQLMMAIPLIAFFEVGMLGARLLYRPPQEAAPGG